MALTPYYYRVAHGPETKLRMLMNGVPFYRSPGGELGASHSGAANHLMIPGENVVTLDVAEVPLRFGILFEINIDLDHKAPVVAFEWPKIWKGLPPAAQVIPFRHDVRFHAAESDFQPAYLRAPRADFGPEGTPELREAVRRYHDVTARGDTDGFLREIELQLDEMSRAYDHNPAFDAGGLRSVMNERFAAGITSRPLDFDEIHFESFVEGRVAYVTRRDGGPALTAESGNGDAMEADLWLTQDRGQWRVFR